VFISDVPARARKIVYGQACVGKQRRGTGTGTGTAGSPFPCFGNFSDLLPRTRQPGET